MIANFDNLKNIPNANQKVFELIQNHWKIFHFSIGGGDAEEGYLIVQDEKEIEALLTNEDNGLLYGPRYGSKSYSIRQIKVKKKFLKTISLMQVKKEKLKEFNKISHKRKEREVFYSDKNNVNEYSRADIIMSCFEFKPLLINMP